MQQYHVSQSVGEWPLLCHGKFLPSASAVSFLVCVFVSAWYTCTHVGQVVAYNYALARSSFVCSDGVLVDSSPPLLADVRAEGVRIRPGLIRYGTGNATQLWLLTADGIRHSVSDLACAGNATPVPSPDVFPDESYVSSVLESNTPLQMPTNNTYAYEIQHGYSLLRGNVSATISTSDACNL